MSEKTEQPRQRRRDSVSPGPMPAPAGEPCQRNLRGGRGLVRELLLVKIDSVLNRQHVSGSKSHRHLLLPEAASGNGSDILLCPVP
jgi:hypothetical protein